MSLETFPKSGMMHNGKLYPRVPLVQNIKGKGFSLLPTPKASDWMKMIFSEESSLKATFGSHVNSTPIHVLKMIGLSPTESFYEWLMGFPKKWTDLNHSETL